MVGAAAAGERPPIDVAVDVAPVVNRAFSPEVTIRLKVTDAEAKPFTGEVELYSQAGHFAGGEYGHVKVRAEAGLASCTLLLSPSDPIGQRPITVFAMKDGQQVGMAEFVVRVDEHIAISATRPRVSADDQEQPVVTCEMRDQFGEALPHVQVTWLYWTPASRRGKGQSVTNTQGRAAFVLPASGKSGYAHVQAVTQRLASPQIFVLYRGETDPDWSALREVARAAGLALAWDGRTQTAFARGGHIRLEVRVGSDNAVINGLSIPLASPAAVRQGRLLLPMSFVTDILGVRTGLS